MSRLVYKGNLISNFGEYYPTPYIDQIVLNAAEVPCYKPPCLPEVTPITFTIDYAFLFLAPEVESTVPTFDVAPIKAAIEELNFYFLITKSLTKEDPLREHAEMAEHSTIQTYAEATGNTLESSGPTGTGWTGGHTLAGVEDSIDELSLLLYDSSLLVEFLKNHEDVSGVGFDIVEIPAADLIDAIDDLKYVVLYDEIGRRIIKIPGQIVTEVEVSVVNTDTSVDAPIYEPNMNVLAFSSLLSAAEMVTSPLTTNSAMTTYLGDVAYERVLEKGVVPDQTEISYFDANNDLYNETPLQTVSGKYYKADTTNHELIVSKFTELLDGYESYTTAGEGDEQVTDDDLVASIGVVRYVLELYGMKIDLLPRINKARRSFITQSTVETTGALYEDLSVLLNRTNTVVKRSPELTKKLTVNAKILDKRILWGIAWTFPTPSPIPDVDLLSNFFIGRSVIQTDEISTRVTFGDFDVAEGTRWEDLVGSEGMAGGGGDEVLETVQLGTVTVDGVTVTYAVVLEDPIYNGLLTDDYFAWEEYNISFGYSLFDYQAALINNSYLATLIDVNQFIDNFGLDYLQTFYIPTRFRLIKFLPVHQGATGPFGAPAEPLVSYQKDLYESIFSWTYTPDGSVPTEIAYTGATTATEGGGTGFPTKITTNTGTILGTYLTERNMQFLTPLIDMSTSGTQNNPDYKMMAFEFQNIDQFSTLDHWNSKTNDEYQIRMVVYDNTIAAMRGVIAHYWLTLQTLKEYLIDAEAACSWNNIDGMFNDFFADAITQKYGLLPAAAPWIYGVTVFIKHLDFLFRMFGGDEAQRLVAAKEQIQKISPYTGTLQQLQTFVYNFDSLYTEYYSTSSPLGTALASGAGDWLWTNFYRGGDPSASTDDGAISSTESTFIADARNEFLSKINAERERYLAAQEAYDAAIARAEAKAEAAAGTLGKCIEDRTSQVNYEYGKVKMRPDAGAGCNYAIYADKDYYIDSGFFGGLIDYSNPQWIWVDGNDEYVKNYDTTYLIDGEPSPFAQKRSTYYDFKVGPGKNLGCLRGPLSGGGYSIGQQRLTGPSGNPTVHHWSKAHLKAEIKATIICAGEEGATVEYTV